MILQAANKDPGRDPGSHLLHLNTAQSQCPPTSLSAHTTPALIAPLTPSPRSASAHASRNLCVKPSDKDRTEEEISIKPEALGSRFKRKSRSPRQGKKSVSRFIALKRNKARKGTAQQGEHTQQTLSSHVRIQKCTRLALLLVCN